MATCRIAAGTIFAKDLSVADQPYLSLGNAQLVLAIEEETQELPDYESVAGGNKCSVRDVSAVNLTVTMYDFDKKNLALAVFGESSEPAGGSVSNESVMLFAEGVTPLLHIPTNTGTLMVGVTTYLVDDDYIITKGGIQVVPGGALDTAIAAGTGTPKHLVGEFDYTYAVEDVVEALVTSGKTFALRVYCQNKAAGAKEEVWDFWKVQFGPTGGINIISREFGSFEVPAECLADDTKGVDESKFFKIQQAQ